MSNLQINDTSERKKALDLSCSFIVQAPAGSGKTELLTQRFLKLLAYGVQSPEEIIAVTFTKKAAAEMQDRIINALHFAQINPKPSDDFAATTWQFAKDTLKQDQKLNWQLLTNPNRLRIQTIDALCMSLTQQMPILSRFGSQPKISDYPKALYEKATRNVLENIGEKTDWHDALLQLLEHLDNNVSKVENLLINMLSKRDQWLPYVAQTHTQTELRTSLEKGLVAITADQLEKIDGLFSNELANELIELANFAANNLQNTGVESDILSCINLKSLPDKALHSKSIWLGIAQLLLTKQGTLRKVADKKIGFPATSSTKDKTEKALYEMMKTQMKLFLEKLETNVDFVEALHELRITPPFKYHDNQWQTLSALLKLLPIAAAQLVLVFREKSEVDFAEVTQAALMALSTFDEPTDLALSLDYQIKHILVDEFQDTAISQLHLLELLTAGFQKNDGRTLFIVGDPMQSIYRFRQAEVGLFLRARHEGIGHINLIPLTLSANFRSSKTMVDWINTHCSAMFPTHEDISDGAVTYNNAIATHQTKDTAVEIHALIDATATLEAEHIVNIIKQHQNAHPKDSIAILVKARSHLFEILPMLRANNLPYRAIEIEKLDCRPIIQDLYALTKALLHPADRTAWFSILRAPWCGLTLKDLQIIASPETNTTILDNIQQKEMTENLSKDGQNRLATLKIILLKALTNRRRKSLRDFIHNTWIDLKAPACYTESADLDDATHYFELLDKLDVGSDIKDFTLLEEKITQLYASPDVTENEQLQVMTIHKAKGLEFNTVIIPGLQHSTMSDEAQLLLWAERPRTHKENDLILAPIKASHEINDPIYDFLSCEIKKKNNFEGLRLLYVAMTRAKNYLHLLGSASTTDNGETLKNPTPTSFLGYLWPLIRKNFFEKLHSEHSTQTSTVKPPHTPSEGIRRLSNIIKTNASPIQADINEPIILDNNFIQQNYHAAIGTLVHQILQQISIDGINTWHTEHLDKNHTAWKNILLQLGVLPHEIDSAADQACRAITNTLADTKGRWILNDHTAAQSEYRLTLKNGKQIIIDRTFIDENNIRWIIDYKTTDETIEAVDDFIKTAKQQHLKQIENYAAAIKHFGNEKIHAALYYPLQKIWIEWEIINDEDTPQQAQ